MTRAMPKPIDHFLVQADLTVVVPGPLQRELADDLAAVATVESAGAAMVYRDQRAVDPACARHRQDPRLDARTVHEALQNSSAARAYLPHR